MRCDESMSRDAIGMCGLWRFQPDVAQEGEKAGYQEVGYDDTRWREVWLPNGFDRLHPHLDAYEGAGWFRRAVTVPSQWEGRRVLLCFHGVNYHAEVWVNGQCVGEHEDGFLPFEFSVRDVLRFGEANLVAVRADNIRRPGDVPGMQRGWRTFGGILRKVDLMTTDLCYLDHVWISAEPVADGGSMAIRATIANERLESIELELLVTVRDQEGKEILTFASGTMFAASGEAKVVTLQEKAEGVDPWSPVDPRLYVAKVSLLVDGGVVDEQQVRFGFRRIEAREGRLLLNGEPIYLTGFNRHEDSPTQDMAADLETARRDLVDMKNAGANFVRLCHYPHHPGELDLCDELGLLAMGEIPLYWWNGYEEGEDRCRDKLDAAKRQLRKMIRRDVNHPSVIFWSVSNENQEDRPEVAEGNRTLVRIAKGLDPTRLAVHVSDHWQRYPNFACDDVICINGYPSLHKHAYDGEYDYDLFESTRFWREGLQALHERYPNKPILISEFGYAALEDVHGSTFGEGMQAEAIEREFAGMDAPYVCGATVWCWADHPWPAATFQFCRYLAISPYGVVTRERRKLKAYWTVRRLFREKQGVGEKPQVASATPGAAGYNLMMVRPHMNDIPQVSFPEGYRIRPMRLGEGALWTDIERDAEAYFPIWDDQFEREFARDLQATQWRCFLIVDEKGVAVGTISAWYDRTYKGQDYGQIHWLARAWARLRCRTP
jgi:beta-glucuronidase